MKKICIHCRSFFETKKNVPQQSYCSELSCQRARKQSWHAHKLRSDQDYRTNQRKAQKAWQNSHPEYWKKYRDKNALVQPSDNTVEGNFAFQSFKKVVDESLPLKLNGLFELRVLRKNRRVKMDVYIVEMKRHSGYANSGKNVKR